MTLVPLDTGGLDDRDAGLANAIYDAVIRRWMTLECLLDSALKTHLGANEPAMQAVLLAGAAQVFFLDRVPAHAVINESVELAKRLVRQGAGGLTNAVLRKMAGLRARVGPPSDAARRQSPSGATAAPFRDDVPLSDGRVLQLSAPTLPGGAVEYMAAATSHPPWLIRRWTAQLGADAARSLALHSLISAPTILNTAHATAPLPSGLSPHSSPGHHVFAGRRIELVELLESRRDIWVQDPASSAAVAGASELRPATIIDACAGQGTKTRQLAATFPSARIVASDVDPARFRTLFSEFRGSDQVLVVPARELLDRFAGKADLVLLDVPCSNSGVLARRTEAKYRCSEHQLQRLAAIQRQIITDTLPLRSPHGRVLYSTCSIDADENTAITGWARVTHRLSIEREATVLPAAVPGDAPATYHDGSFAALLA